MTASVIRLPEVIARTGLSRTSIYRRVRRGEFPRPIALGPRAVGWAEREVSAWIESRPVAGMAPCVTRPSAADAA